MSLACTNASPPSNSCSLLARSRASSAFICLLFLAAACAAPAPRTPRIERSLVDTVAGSGQATEVQRLSLADIVSAARAGASPEAVAQRWRDDGARLPLTAANILELHALGVAAAHLDALLAAREQAVRTDYETRIAAQRVNADAALAAERSRVQRCPATYGPYPYWGPFPYAGWGSGVGGYGGIRFGW